MFSTLIHRYCVYLIGQFQKWCKIVFYAFKKFSVVINWMTNKYIKFKLTLWIKYHENTGQGKVYPNLIKIKRRESIFHTQKFEEWNMPPVLNEHSEDFLNVDSEQNSFSELRAESLEGLSIFGNKPNAIVRPLQHFQSENGLNALEKQILTEKKLKHEKPAIVVKQEVTTDAKNDKFRLYGAYPKDTSRNVIFTFWFNHETPQSKSHFSRACFLM